MKGVPFNINDYVYVKLTDRGRAIHRQQFDEFNRHVMSLMPREYTPPKEDENGWSKWQLWVLMSTFGEHCHMGDDPPFETKIQFEIDGERTWSGSR